MTPTQAGDTPKRVFRYRGLLGVAIVLIAIGIVARSPSLLVGGTIPLMFVLQGILSTGRPVGERVRVERAVTPGTPLPGQPVTVRLTIENCGDRTIPDLRFVDGFPDRLAVAEGSARGNGWLRPGDSATTTYTLVANRGAYEFDSVTVRARNVAGTVIADAQLTAEGDDGFAARVSADDVPLRRQTTAFTGPLATESGGPGVEFYATREYRNGDPLNRINWRRYAKDGHLATVQYREQRAARVAIVIDGRETAHVSASQVLPTGATLGAYGATLAIDVLLSEGHQLGVGSFGVADPLEGSRPAWVSSDEASAFPARAAAVCNAAATGAGDDVSPRASLLADGGRSFPEGPRRELLSRVPTDAQILFCTPAVDATVVDDVKAFLVAGHETTVLSPDVTSETVGGRIVALERAERLDRFRTLGATVVDWDRDERLPIALARTLVEEGR